MTSIIVKIPRSGILLQQLENIHLIVNFYLTIYLQLSIANIEYIRLQPSLNKLREKINAETRSEQEETIDTLHRCF